MGKRVLFLVLMFVFLLSGNIYSQEINKAITGNVADESGAPIAGVTVKQEGTTNGTATDADGRYSINCGKTATLVFSYVGYVTQKIKVNNRSIINITMQDEASNLDEVMVVAYGTAKKSSYSGSASLVKEDALKDVPVTTFENALNGKVSGLQITNTSGQAGAAPTIRIRGIGSMNASNSPLYVIDGVPVTSGNVGQMGSYTYSGNNVMNSLNPDDIESISVLKDAAASSLYGSRAANGVILITTKKGQEGKANVNLNYSIGFTPSWATKNYEAASTEEQVKMLYMIFHDYRTSNGKTDDDANAYALKQLNKKFNKFGYAFTTDGTGLNANVIISDYNNSGRAGTYYDWDKALFRSAMYQNYDLAVSGASPSTNYYTSFAYTKDEGRIKINSFDRFSGRVNLNTKVGKFFEIGTNVSASRTKTSGYNDTRTTGNNVFMQSRNLLWGLYWPTDYSTGKDWTSRYGSYAYNPLYYNNQWENSSINNKLTAVETVTVHLLPVLNVRSIFSYDITTVKDHVYYSALHFDASSENGEVDEMRTQYTKMVSSTTANYSQTFGMHTVQAMAGFEAEKNKTDFTRSTGTNLPTSTLHTVSTAGTLEAAGYNWGNSMVSLLSKFDYNYNEKYYLSASLRRDGSSRLSKDSRWGNFWSVAGSWNIIVKTS
jgi:TonB-linked SusC/RagA family outer membrane protein